jgi:lysozyme
MISRRTMLAGTAGLASSTLTGCAAPRSAPRLSRVDRPPPPLALRLDAVIDISHRVAVSDFALVRRSQILAVVHKASEGGDWVDPLYAVRRRQAEAAGLLWGAYHFGTHQYSGAEQAAAFIAAAQPDPATLIALDFEPNEQHPANTMELAQAEAFVHAVHDRTGRLPLVYTHPIWANGGPYGRAGVSLGAAISPRSILARCDLWLADYRDGPETPLAWADRGWRMWQYSGDDPGDPDGPYGAPHRPVAGVDYCDRNLFIGDPPALYRFWKGGGAGV